MRENMIFPPEKKKKKKKTFTIFISAMLVYS